MTRRERGRWKKLYLRFLRKVVLLSGRRPVLKSPYNTARVAVLREMFPGAKFIHLRRHPHDVYCSNVNLHEQGFVLLQLQDPNPQDNYVSRFPRLYREVEEAYWRDTADLPADQVVEVAFEDLERDPAGEIERIYDQLALTVTPKFRARLEAYLQDLAGYRRSVYEPLDPAVAESLNAELRPVFERGGYDPDRAP